MPGVVLRGSRRFRRGLASVVVSSFILGLGVVGVPGCGPEGVESAPKMKGKKDDIQSEGSGLPITPSKTKSKRK